MNFAEHLRTIEGNVPKVYQAGYDDGVAAESYIDYTSHCSLIRFTSFDWLGKQSVAISLPNCTDLSRFWFAETEEQRNSIVEHLTIDGAKPTDMYYFLFFAWAVRDEVLKRVTLNIDTSNVTNFGYAFANALALETIDGNPLDLSKATSLAGIFTTTNNLTEVRFVANSIKLSLSLAPSSKLSAATIQSIIDGLADLTGKNAQTLTLHATVGGKLTQAQKDTAKTKNWTLAY